MERSVDSKAIKELVQRSSDVRRRQEEKSATPEGRLQAAAESGRRIDAWITKMASTPKPQNG